MEMSLRVTASVRHEDRAQRSNLLRIFLISILFLFPSSAWAALSVVQLVVNADLGDASFATTIAATGSGNLIVVAITGGVGAQPVTSVTDGTNSFREYPGFYGTGSTYFTDVWYLPYSTSGKTSITVNLSSGATGHHTCVGIWEVSGFINPYPDGEGSVYDVASGATDTGASVTTTSNSDFIASQLHSSDSYGQQSTNFTTSQASDSDGVTDSALITSSQGTYAPTWPDNPTNTFTSMTAAFKNQTTTSSTIVGKSTIAGNSTVY
jgi:hypothetical protein